jgi:antitoxin HigA-1
MYYVIHNSHYKGKFYKRARIMENLIELEHIGIIFFEEFMKPYKLSQNALARLIGVPANRINDIVKGRRSITADTDLRLTKLFGLSEGFFLRIQEDYNIRIAKRQIEKELTHIIPIEMNYCAI